MSEWFVRADSRPGINLALAAGSVAALVYAGMNAYGIAVRAFGLQPFGAHYPTALRYLFFMGATFRVFLGLIAARRFAIGKGMVWGSVALLFCVAPVVGYFFIAQAAPIGWVILRFPMGAALIAGIYGAWVARNAPSQTDYIEVFE